MNIQPYIDNQIQFNLPPNKKFFVWLSHDVDRVYKTFLHSCFYAIKERNIHHFSGYFQGTNSYWNFERILSLESKHNVKSTFFFLNERMKANLLNPKSFILAKGRYNILNPEIQKIIRTIDEEGWEVGLHGSYNSYLDESLLDKEKQTLENIIQHPIAGIRQHYLNLSIPETWKIQKSLGLKYDASFGLTRDVGFRDEVYYPFRPFNDEFIVFPLTIMERPLFDLSKNTDDAWQTCLKLINIAEEKGTLLSLLWHQRIFDENGFPGYRQMYEKIIIECLKRGAQFCTGKDIFHYIKN